MPNLSVLELYVLSCLNQGMQTSYDLLRGASLSLGATTPALKRLVDTGRITRKDKTGATARPRYEYKLTSKGTEAMHAGIIALVDDSKGDEDIDTVLRIVDMGRRHGAPTGAISKFLKRASDQRQRLAKHAAVDAGYQGWEYPKLRIQIDAARLQAEATVLADLVRRSESSQRRRTNTEGMHQELLI